MRNPFVRFRLLRAPVPVAAAGASLVIGIVGLVLTHPSPSDFSEFTAYVIATDASAGSPSPEVSAILDAQLIEQAPEAVSAAEETPVAQEPVANVSAFVPRVSVAAAGEPTSVQPIAAPEPSEPEVPEPAPAGPPAGPVAAAASAGGGAGVASPAHAPALPGVTITMTGSSKAKPSPPPPTATPTTVKSTRQAPTQPTAAPTKAPTTKPAQNPDASKQQKKNNSH